MKKLLFTLLCLFAGVQLLSAQSTAVMLIKVGKEKKPQRVVIELNDAQAPKTVENFKRLARKGFYKGIRVHRVIPHMLVQVGDPLSKKKDRSKVGTGGPGYTIPGEIGGKHVAGAVAMARLPDSLNPSRRSSGSQFYITVQPMPSLDGQYTVFGRVTEGLEVIDALSAKPADSNDNPMDKITIRSIKVTPR